MDRKNRNTALLILAVATLAVVWGGSTVFRIFREGLQVLSLDQKVVWGVLIANFVFWIGLAHAGTFISAILLLLRQDWRKGIHRLAEATTLAAIVIALLMPVLHLGRPGMFYELMPNPNLKMNFQLVNYSSPLTWDFYAIPAYFILSVLFFYVGIIPDFGWKKKHEKNRLAGWMYYSLSAGWKGSREQWALLSKVNVTLAALIAPLVISVHTIVSFDFAVSHNPAWHQTTFPLYFVTGAINSGFVLVLFCLIVFEKLNFTGILLSEKQLNNLNKIILFCSILLAGFYLIELISAAETPDWSRLQMTTLLLVVVVPQLLWVHRLRKNKLVSALVSLLILLGMWLERFVIVIQGQEKAYLTQVEKIHLNLADLSLVFGTVGLLILLLAGISWLVPMVPGYEKAGGAHE